MWCVDCCSGVTGCHAAQPSCPTLLSESTDAWAWNVGDLLATDAVMEEDAVDSSVMAEESAAGAHTVGRGSSVFGPGMLCETEEEHLECLAQMQAAEERLGPMHRRQGHRRWQKQAGKVRRDLEKRL